MTREQAFVMLNDIVRDVLESECLTVDEATLPASLPGWDKLAEIDVLAAAEVRFGVRIRAAEAERVRRMGELVDLILAKAPPLPVGP
ncbi:MAG: acyl carrier protein [Stellaceae bacterium]